MTTTDPAWCSLVEPLALRTREQEGQTVPLEASCHDLLKDYPVPYNHQGQDHRSHHLLCNHFESPGAAPRGALLSVHSAWLFDALTCPHTMVAEVPHDSMHSLPIVESRLALSYAIGVPSCVLRDSKFLFGLPGPVNRGFVGLVGWKTDAWHLPR